MKRDQQDGRVHRIGITLANDKATADTKARRIYRNPLLWCEEIIQQEEGVANEETKTNDAA
jgi:hypothetical protein